MKYSKGFTLIELLVVIAIIGILATMVISSLGQARTRARDAAIRAAISSARADLEMSFLDTGTYITSGEVCDATVNTFTTSIVTNGGDDVECNATASTYAYFATLNSGIKFCADSTGFAGERTASLPATGAMACN